MRHVWPSPGNAECRHMGKSSRTRERCEIPVGSVWNRTYVLHRHFKQAAIPTRTSSRLMPATPRDRAPWRRAGRACHPSAASPLRCLGWLRDWLVSGWPGRMLASARRRKLDLAKTDPVKVVPTNTYRVGTAHFPTWHLAAGSSTSLVCHRF